MRHRTKKKIRVECGWFALCRNEAVTTRSHPALGKVPICDRCNERTERMSSGE